MKFDFVDCSVKAYQFIARDYLTILALAWIPLAIKFFSFLVIVFLGLSEDFLKQGLLLIPSNFVEGWFLASLIRLAVLGERYPESLSGDARQDQFMMMQRGTSMKISIIAYVLIKLVSAALVGTTMGDYFSSIGEDGQDQSVPSYLLLVMLVLMFAMLWSFRYLWLYIPPVLGLSSRAFLKQLGGMMGSFRLMAVWTLCFAPAFVVIIVLSDLLDRGFPETTLADGSLLYIVLYSALQNATELFVSAVTSIALAYAVYDLAKDRPL
jgi:hypothetical protein